MPMLAIIGILYVTAMTTASGRDNLLKVGAMLFVAAMLHNLAGYFFGYFLSRGSRAGQKFRAKHRLRGGPAKRWHGQRLGQRDGQAGNRRACGGDLHPVDEPQWLHAGKLLGQTPGE